MLLLPSRRWSGSTSSSSDTSAPATPWMDDVFQTAELSYRPDMLESPLTEEAQEQDLDIGKGKGKQETTDEELARSLFAEEALKGFSEYNGEYGTMGGADSQNDREGILKSFCAAQSSRQAIDDLGLLLKLLQKETEQNSSAGASSTVEPPSTFEPPIDSWADRDANTFMNLSRLLAGAGSGSPAEHNIQLPAVEPDCAVCGEAITGKDATLLCGHRYDIDCLKNMFSANVDDEYRFPPRCCGQVVSMNHIEVDIPRETAELYREKIAEYETPCRLYCCNAQCAKFLGPRQECAAPAHCGSCGTETCALCTAPAHPATVRCTVDKGLRKALVLGQARGWQRCPRCRQLVERNNGCYHMSCRCGAQFCYLCAAAWKTCSCTGGTSRFLRLIGARRLRMRGNYLVKGELGPSADGSLKRFCKRSWRSVINVVTPSPKA
ncbi:hypothetical protein DFH11DRAFT_1213550 [Phellopilus nigrolimitatus]|nr:hypothetical protein DFH11DRAFT_1213550 [Phellopilus nigrolimitatus]